MNENATDESTPTGKALGNVALVALSAAAIVGGGVFATKTAGKLANGAKGLAKGAQNKVASKVANRKTAKDIKNEAKNIANNHGSELTSGEVNNLAEQNQMMSNYTTQANPDLDADQIKDLNIARGEQNIENHKNLRDISAGDIPKRRSDVDVTTNLDDVFDTGFDYGDGNVVPPTNYSDSNPRTSFDIAHNSETADLKTVQEGFDGLDMPTKTNDYNIKGDDVRKNIEDVSLDDIRNAKKTPQEQEKIKQAAEEAARDREYDEYITSKNNKQDKGQMNMLDDNQQLSMFDKGYNEAPSKPVEQAQGQTSMFDQGLPKEQEAELARMQKEKENNIITGTPVGKEDLPSILPGGQARVTRDIDYGTGTDYAEQSHKTDPSTFFGKDKVSNSVETPSVEAPSVDTQSAQTEILIPEQNTNTNNRKNGRTNRNTTDDLYTDNPGKRSKMKKNRVKRDNNKNRYDRKRRTDYQNEIDEI